MTPVSACACWEESFPSSPERLQIWQDHVSALAVAVSPLLTGLSYPDAIYFAKR